MENPEHHNMMNNPTPNPKMGLWIGEVNIMSADTASLTLP